MSARLSNVVRIVVVAGAAITGSFVLITLAILGIAMTAPAQQPREAPSVVNGDMTLASEVSQDQVPEDPAASEPGYDRLPNPSSEEKLHPPSETGAETALRCLVGVARQHGTELAIDRLRHTHSVDQTTMDAASLLRIARNEGLKARKAQLNWSSLVQLRNAYPVIVLLTNGNWVVVVGASDDGTAVQLFDPLAFRAEPLLVGRDKFSAMWTGEALLVKRGRRAPKAGSRFNFRWFIPELMREWRLFADVAIAALLLYALALVTPIFFQLVIDKVLVHESYSTLYVLAGGVAVALVFEAAFSFLRRYLLLYALEPDRHPRCDQNVRASAQVADQLLRAQLRWRPRQAYATGRAHPRFPHWTAIPDAA